MHDQIVVWRYTPIGEVYIWKCKNCNKICDGGLLNIYFCQNPSYNKDKKVYQQDEPGAYGDFQLDLSRKQLKKILKHYPEHNDLIVDEKALFWFGMRVEDMKKHWPNWTRQLWN